MVDSGLSEGFTGREMFKRELQQQSSAVQCSAGAAVQRVERTSGSAGCCLQQQRSRGKARRSRETGQDRTGQNRTGRKLRQWERTDAEAEAEAEAEAKAKAEASCEAQAHCIQSCFAAAAAAATAPTAAALPLLALLSST